MALSEYQIPDFGQNDIGHFDIGQRWLKWTLDIRKQNIHHFKSKKIDNIIVICKLQAILIT